MAIPHIDPNVAHVGTSKLRELNAYHLQKLEKLLVIQDGDKPLAVIVPYEWFLEMQSVRLAQSTSASSGDSVDTAIA